MTPKDKVKKLLETKRPDLSIARLEQTLGISNGTIGKWDKATPSAKTAQKIANYFNVSVDYLLGDSDEMIPKIEASGLSRKNSDELLNATDGLDQEEMQQLINLARMLKRNKG